MAVLQGAPDPTVIGQVERLSLVGALIIAVAVLWRKLEAKDSSVSESQVSLTKAFVTNTEVMRELKDVVTGLKSTVETLDQSVEKMVTIRETLADFSRKRDAS